MINMMQWLSQYWYLLVILVVACIVTAVIMFFAARAYSEHARGFRKQDEEMKRLLALKEKFYNFDKATIDASEDAELLEGVALSYQLRLQKQENPEEAFSLMSEEKKLLYVLDVFCSDADIKVFYKENGRILKDLFVPALKKIGCEAFADKAQVIYNMYDEENENVSYSEKEIQAVNDYIESEKVIDTVRVKSAVYIRQNYDIILN